MINLKINGIVAGMAFILSFLIGLVSRTSMPMAVIRPLIFGILFFIISNMVGFLVNRFLPELLERDSAGEDSDFLPGSRVDITLGEDSQNYARDNEGVVPAVPKGSPSDDEELGNINEMMERKSGSLDVGEADEGMDQDAIDGYTKAGSMEDFSFPISGNGGGQASAGFNAVSDGGSSSAEVLPDLDSMAGAFFPSPGGEEPETADYSVPAPARKPASSKKAPEWTEDFNAKDIAMGLRTVLNKEKED